SRTRTCRCPRAISRPTAFDPLSFWTIVRDHHVTWYSAVPTMHQLLLSRIEKGAPRPMGAEHLRFIRSCGASLPSQVMHDLEDMCGEPGEVVITGPNVVRRRERISDAHRPARRDVQTLIV